MKSYIAKLVILFLFLHKVTANSDFAPDTLIGKTLQITEATNNGEFKAEFYFRSNMVYYEIPSSNRFEAISYSYVKSAESPSNATLTMFGRDEGDVIHEMVFSSSTSATSNWEDNSSSGFGSLEISDESLVPSSLDDLIFSGKSDQNSKSTKDIFKFEDSNNSIYYYSFAENFSERKLYRLNYTWEQNSSRIGILKTESNETLELFFESDSTGFFYWTEIANEKDMQSGRFKLDDVSGGNAYESLVGSTITIGDLKYSFISSDVTELQTTSGSNSKEFVYLKNSFNEALLFVDPNLYRLNFQSTDFGAISEGGETTFQVSHNVATKGWIFNGFSPWIYSNKLGSWYYKVLFSNSDSNTTESAHFESWRNIWTKNDDLKFSEQRAFTKNPEKSYPKGWLWTEHLPWAYCFETGGWLYFELANDVDGKPAMNYYDYSTNSWGLYGSY
jgi:hypothetical protein